MIFSRELFSPYLINSDRNDKHGDRPFIIISDAYQFNAFLFFKLSNERRNVYFIEFDYVLLYLL